MTRHTTSFIVLAFILILISCSDKDAAISTPGTGMVTPSPEAATPSPGGGTPSPEASTMPQSQAREAVILVHGWSGSPRDLSPLKTFLDSNGFRSFIAILPGEDNIK